MSRKTSLIAVAALSLFATFPARSAPPCPIVPSLLADGIPEDVCSGGDKFPAFANMAWQTFKMLVWPARTSSNGVPMRGVADTSLALSYRDAAKPRVFETFKSSWETFPVRGAQPSDWNTYPATAEVCGNNPALRPGTLVLASLNEFGNITEMAFRDISHVLVAQNGSLVRYLAGFNRSVFDLVRNQRLYDGSLPFLPDGQAPSARTTAPSGSITVKSAWIEISSTEADRFHARRALIQDPGGKPTCREAIVGLVGLHIVHKTRSHPQWVWASFEHINNAPLRGERYAPGSTFNFNDGKGRQMAEGPPRNSINPMGDNWQTPKPFNVERLAPIAPDVERANALWRSTLAGSVWANYELVVVQWPGLNHESFDGLSAQPTPPCFDAWGTNLVNTTIETFRQHRLVNIGPACTSKETCMGCHNIARGADFIWSIKLNDRDQPGTPSGNRQSGLDSLSRITTWKSE